jgi:hypothetical protein
MAIRYNRDYCTFVCKIFYINLRFYSMKKISLFVILITTLIACNNKPKGPDVSGIKADVKIERFEKSFFSLDTNTISQSLLKLQQEFPGFYFDYMQNLLGVSGSDTSYNTVMAVKQMIGSYSSLNTIVQKKIGDIGKIEKELEQSIKYVKYYFPDYKIPKFTSFIGTLDAPGVALTDNYIAIGLQQYAGKDFEGYLSKEVQQLYPTYISRRFEPAYIATNCIKTIVTDIFPDKSKGKNLLEQMIEKGKEWYVLSLLMPGTADSLKTGYTQKQLDWCKTEEGQIFNYITQRENIETIDQDIIKYYIGEAPFTQGMPESFSPGNIGQWVGWQIVNKYAAKNSSLSVKEIMNTSPRAILDGAKYKPK